MMCNVPEEVVDAIGTFTAKYEWEHGQDDKSNMVFDWLDSLPAAPEPDWSQAPEWATHFIYDYSGEHGIWFSEYDVAWGDDFPCIEDVVFTGTYQTHEQRKPLPLGIDWRTTLRERPTDGDSG